MRDNRDFPAESDLLKQLGEDLPAIGETSRGRASISRGKASDVQRFQRALTALGRVRVGPEVESVLCTACRVVDAYLVRIPGAEMAAAAALFSVIGAGSVDAGGNESQPQEHDAQDPKAPKGKSKMSPGKRPAEQSKRESVPRGALIAAVKSLRALWRVAVGGNSQVGGTGAGVGGGKKRVVRGWAGGAHHAQSLARLRRYMSLEADK